MPVTARVVRHRHHDHPGLQGTWCRSQPVWCAIVTMTTLGYRVPGAGHRRVGRLLGTLCALCGVIVMALPIAVIASMFTSYHDNLSSRQLMRARAVFLEGQPALLLQASVFCFVTTAAASRRGGREGRRSSSRWKTST